MSSLIKCNIFTIYANNLLFISTIWMAIFLSTSLVAIYSLDIFWGIATLTGIFLGLPKSLVFFRLKPKVGSEPM